MVKKSFGNTDQTVDLKAKRGMKIILMYAVWDFFEFVFKGFKFHDFMWVVSILLFTLPFLLVSRKRRSGIPLFFMINVAQIMMQIYVCMYVDDKTPFPFFRLMCSACLLYLAFFHCFSAKSEYHLWRSTRNWKW